MKTLSILPVLLWLSTSLTAQAIQCPKEDCGRFQRFIKSAEDAADKPDFNQAIIQYNAARVCCPSAAEAIDAEILKIFELIENQRNMAAANADRAKKAEAKTKSALEKAERLVGFFGFTQNRAWAYKNGKFAVIDRNGTQWTDFVFESPDPFQSNGYALARKGGFYVLVDTLGRTSQEYDYLLPTNHGCYKVRKEKKYTFADFKGNPLPGANWYESIDTFCNGLAIVNKKDHWGFINSRGIEEIKAEFQSVTSFEGDVAWAANDNGKWGLINKKGQFITPQVFSNGMIIAPGISFARIPGKWGVVDDKGRYLAQPKYDQIRDFEDGMALVVQNGKQGYINAKGEEVIPPQFELITSFSEGLAIALIDTMRAFIDTTGKQPFPGRFEKATNFSEGLAAVKKTKEEKWGYIDKTGAFVILPKYETAYAFTDSLAWVIQSDKKKRLIDRKGNYISDLAVDDFTDFQEDLAAIKIEERWGFIDKKGNPVIPAKYANVNLFEGGLVSVKLEGKWGFIDKKGNPVIPANYTSVSSFSDDLALVGMDDKYGYINRNGTIAIQPKYTEANDFAHGAAAVKNEKGWGLINKKGDWLIEPQYDQISVFSEGLAFVYLIDKADYEQSKYGYIDTLGRLVLPLQYTSATVFSEGLARVSMDRDSSWGFIERSGKFIFKQKVLKNQRNYGYDGEYRYFYRRNDQFYDGLATVIDSGRVGFIDKTGAWAIKPQFETAYYGSEGKIMVNVGGESGLLNDRGEFIKKIKFKMSDKRSDGILALYNSDYKMGYLHLTKDTLVEPKFSIIRNFSNGTAWVSVLDEKQYTTKWGLIDENGKYIIEPKYNNYREASDGLIWVTNDYYWTLIDKQAKNLPTPEVESFGNFSEGLTWVERNGLRGYVDNTGNPSIPFRYDVYYNGDVASLQDEYMRRFSGYLRNTSSYENSGDYFSNDDDGRFLNGSIFTGNFSGGLAAAYENEMWGYINKKGAFVIEPKYEWAGDFSDGLAWVKNQKKWGLIDTSGKFVMQPRYDWGMKFSDGFAQVVSIGKFGLIDRSFHEIVKPEYEAIVPFSEGLALVKKDGKWGYINTAGEVVIAPQFDQAGDFIHGKAVVEKFGEQFVINKNGQLIIAEEHAQQPSRLFPDDSRPPSGDR